MSTQPDHHQRVLRFLQTAGQHLVKRSGRAPSIREPRQRIRDELAIERSFCRLISAFGTQHKLYAEEDHNQFEAAEHLWILDPISGTRAFLTGSGHYAIVVAYLHRQRPLFSAVYDPVADELFTACAEKGTFLNGTRVRVRRATSLPTIVLNVSWGWNKPATIARINSLLSQCDSYRNQNSFAVNYCHVACGRYDGAISLGKDVFTELAATLILKEAGGILSNAAGGRRIGVGDRLFAAGSPATHRFLEDVLRSATRRHGGNGSTVSDTRYNRSLHRRRHLST